MITGRGVYVHEIREIQPWGVGYKADDMRTPRDQVLGFGK